MVLVGELGNFVHSYQYYSFKNNQFYEFKDVKSVIKFFILTDFSALTNRNVLGMNLRIKYTEALYKIKGGCL